MSSEQKESSVFVMAVDSDEYSGKVKKIDGQVEKINELLPANSNVPIADPTRETTWKIFFNLWANKRSDETLLKKWQLKEQETQGQIEWMDILWDDVLEDLCLFGLYSEESMSVDEIRREYMEKGTLYDSFVTKPQRRLIETCSVALGGVVPVINLERNNNSSQVIALQELAPLNGMPLVVIAGSQT